jgi:hypothetical protein
MPQHYTDPKRQRDPTVLPDLETFELTAHEVALLDDDLVAEYMRRREFRLASMNSRVREQMLDTIVAENSITGGWFYWFCFPGCLPDSEPIGPFKTCWDAVRDARGC